MAAIHKICKVDINEKMDVQLDDDMYEKIINDSKITPLKYKDVAEDWVKSNNEWYHAKVFDEDIPLLLNNPYVTIYTWSRCKMIDASGENDFHCHALVHFKHQGLKYWLKEATQNNMERNAWKAKYHNRFLKLKCLGKIIQTLHFISCKDEKMYNRSFSKKVGHIRFAQKLIEDEEVHNCNDKNCYDAIANIRQKMGEYMEIKLCEDNKCCKYKERQDRKRGYQWSQEELRKKRSCRIEKGIKKLIAIMDKDQEKLDTDALMFEEDILKKILIQQKNAYK